METPIRSIETNDQGYKEVNLAYRIHRAALLDEREIGSRTNRLVCPMVDAARRKDAYGQQFLPGLEGEDLAQWAKALGVNSLAMKAIAYCSDKLYRIPKNIVTGRFRDKAINTGFIQELKNGVHTGIYKEGQFNQDGFNAFVWAIHPDLEGIAMTNDWLYSEAGAALYFEEAQLEQAMAFNRQNSSASHLGMGDEFSSFEMETLLLGVLGLHIIKEEKLTSAILLRDMHDLYKYGWVPVGVEERLEAAGLLTL
ncbi:MAG: hypothetical protein ACRBFS_20225 [Aureispira sp.]